jgi:hypothetical protein
MKRNKPLSLAATSECIMRLFMAHAYSGAWRSDSELQVLLYNLPNKLLTQLFKLLLNSFILIPFLFLPHT